jgi:hypothetical protein
MIVQPILTRLLVGFQVILSILSQLRAYSLFVQVYKCASPYGYSCPLGTYVSGSNCSLCPAGSYGFGNTTSCFSCSLGRYSPFSGSSICYDCPKNFYADITGASSCTECPNPSYTMNTASQAFTDCKIQMCPSSWVSVSDSSGMHYISNAIVTTAVTHRQAEYQCNTLYHGSHLPFLNSSALAGALPSYASWIGAKSQGSAGSYWLDGTVFSASDTSNLGLSSAASLTTAQCLQRTSRSGKTFGQAWSPCENYQGSLCYLSERFCAKTLCTAGSFLNYTNSPSYPCTACPIGKYQNSQGMLFCNPCPVNTYFASTGATAVGSCLACPIGKWTNQVVGASACTNCSAGFFMSQSMSSCSPCAAGSFQDNSGASSCKTCPSGTGVNTVGSTFCPDCPAGRYSTSSGLCTDCTFGTFQNNSKSSTCRICTPGKYSNTTGQTACSLCSLGQYRRENGQTSCVSCDDGTIANQTGFSTCLSCTAGSYEFLHSSCESCLAGRYSGNRSSLCSPCSLGKFSSTQSSPQCTLCPNNSSTPSFGSISEDQCSICSEGFYGGNSSRCKACPQVTGLSCPYGSQIPFVDAGYYRSKTDPSEIFTCSPPGSCLTTGYLINTPCSFGYDGDRCSICQDGFYRKGGNCNSCPGIAAKVFTILVVLSLVLAILFQFATSSKPLPADVRISLYYLQFLALFPQVTFNWPDALLKFYDWLSITVSHFLIDSSLD